MIEAIAPPEQIRRAYDYASTFYGKLISPLERKPHMRGLELAGILPGDTVLEVAVGPGATFVEIVKRVERTNVVYGVDIAPKMLAKTRQLVAKAGYSNLDLREANAAHLPFPSDMFEVLY